MPTILHEHDCDQDYGQRIDTYLDHKHLIIIGHRQRLLHMLQILLQMVQAALLRMHRSNSQRRHHHRKLSVCPQCISVLAALQPIYLSTEAEKKEEGGRQSCFPTAAAASLPLWPAAGAPLCLCLLAQPRLEATQPLPPSPCLSSNCTSPLHMQQQVYARQFFNTSI